ncbi:GMP synthase subunit A [Candidatus Methanoliparum sp. LAM-1]|uniref:GMP synthase subunit A n=1 Tax=Candidatus Methanoliparum sp. LAM-1 TaxID=2874846 RepID=UPI001E5D0E3E|nr:GMP synthase subunit A [Candidatus Methanoliparum sp. LAM-1]BDC36278.1 GMP synthase [Candidatus Methanoliparum sp. LAM-1]
MIFIIDNYGQYCYLIHRCLEDLNIENKIINNKSNLEYIIDESPIGIILSGGPSLDRIGNCQVYLEKIDIPFLGICLGHQLIAKSFGGKIKEGIEEYAITEIEINDVDDILMGLPKKIKVWSSHKDEVYEISSNLKSLARSDYCKYEAIRHIKRPIYGVQWHPEVYQTEGGITIFKNFVEICRRLNR